MINFATNKIGEVCYGSNKIGSVFYGTNLCWTSHKPEPEPEVSKYLKVTCLDDEGSFGVAATTPIPSMQYSRDCEVWEDFPSANPSVTLQRNESIYVRTTENTNKISNVNGRRGPQKQFNTSGNIKLEGSMISLLRTDGVDDITSYESDAFIKLFNLTTIVSAPWIPKHDGLIGAISNIYANNTNLREADFHDMTWDEFVELNIAFTAFAGDTNVTIHCSDGDHVIFPSN